MLFVLAVFVLTACSSSVMPGRDGSTDSQPGVDVRDVVPGDAGACALPGGGVCTNGATCPAGDGCNACTCRDGVLLCTQRACLDAGPVVDASAGCGSQRDCANGEQCIFDAAGCAARGRCTRDACPPSIGTFCGCDGRTFMTRSACADRPFVARGSCPSTDAGVMCPAGAARDAGGRCVSPSGEPVDVRCCVYDCDSFAVTCQRLPPLCEAGMAPSVSGSCWGECVPIDRCQCNPMLSRLTCPSPALCDPSSAMCRLRP